MSEYKCMDEGIYDHIICDGDHPLIDYRARGYGCGSLIVPVLREYLNDFLMQNVMVFEGLNRNGFNILGITKVEDYAIWSDGPSGHSFKEVVPFKKDEIMTALKSQEEKIKDAVYYEWKNSIVDGRRHEKNRLIFGDSADEKREAKKKEENNK